MPGSFWILHSTPHFPATSQKPDFYFPEKEIIYGQTFLCMSLASNAEVEQVIFQPSANVLDPLHYHYVFNVYKPCRYMNASAS